MKLIAVYEDIYMFVDDDVNELTIDTKCITYNVKTERTSPRIAIGSWTGRMGPWREPTKEELKKDWSFVEKRLDFIPKKVYHKVARKKLDALGGKENDKQRD